MNKLTGENYRTVRINAVLFADAAPDDGDRFAAEVLRLGRLGGLFEGNRCLAMLNRLDPSRLDEASVAESLALLDKSPRTLGEALASLPQDAQQRSDPSTGSGAPATMRKKHLSTNFGSSATPAIPDFVKSSRTPAHPRCEHATFRNFGVSIREVFKRSGRFVSGI